MMSASKTIKKTSEKVTMIDQILVVITESKTGRQIMVMIGRIRTEIIRTKVIRTGITRTGIMMTGRIRVESMTTMIDIRIKTMIGIQIKTMIDTSIGKITGRQTTELMKMTLRREKKGRKIDLTPEATVIATRMITMATRTTRSKIIRIRSKIIRTRRSKSRDESQRKRRILVQILKQLHRKLSPSPLPPPALRSPTHQLMSLNLRMSVFWKLCRDFNSAHNRHLRLSWLRLKQGTRCTNQLHLPLIHKLLSLGPDYTGKPQGVLPRLLPLDSIDILDNLCNGVYHRA